MQTVLRKLPVIARILLGAVFFVFGLNGFLGFLPMPPMPGEAGAFLGALVSAKFLPVVKAIEVVAGLMLLTGRFVPLALLLLAPIVVSIVLFHGVLAPEGMAMPIVTVALGLYLAWSYRDAFRGVLDARARPHAPAATSRVGAPSRSAA
jgi:uncharacterized membrane protein YphA (DoxX/SURF4 family)